MKPALVVGDRIDCGQRLPSAREPLLERRSRDEHTAVHATRDEIAAVDVLADCLDVETCEARNVARGVVVGRRGHA
jgi:hypothetical protein